MVLGRRETSGTFTTIFPGQQPTAASNLLGVEGDDSGQRHRRNRRPLSLSPINVSWWMVTVTTQWTVANDEEDDDPVSQRSGRDNGD